MTIGLNHTFLRGIARRAPGPGDFSALEFLDLVRRRTRLPLWVHPKLLDADTGRGPFVAWASRARGDPDRRELVELLLRTTGGPWLTDLGPPYSGAVEPPVSTLEGWLEESVRILLAYTPTGLSGLVSPDPAGGADAPRYTAANGGRAISNWSSGSALDAELVQAGAARSTADVLGDAERQMAGRLVVLPSAHRSAAGWSLDCGAADLHRSLLGLEAYARALARRDSAGARVPREACIEEYWKTTGIPMSQESADVWKRPTRRRQRLFEAGPHGEQYFDVHAKPGNLTRVHVWVHVDSDDETAAPVVYVGHCGRHLD